MKYIITIFLTATVSVVSQLFLPFAVNIAYTERGYFAIGGEWGLIVLSLISSMFFIEALINFYSNKSSKKVLLTAGTEKEDK